MEVGFWRYLCQNEGADALPLKQRIPEVALFNGHELSVCYYSDARGLLLRRPVEEATREKLLNRLLTLSTGHLSSTDIDTTTPVAIFRVAPEVQDSTVPPKPAVLSVAQVVELLDRPDVPSSNLPAEWSLQSIVTPTEDLRIVAAYSRDELGTEQLDVVGRRYQALYQIAGIPAASGQEDGASVPVPEAPAAAVEAKLLSLVRYVQRFYNRYVESLLAEFVVDINNRVILHTFWKVSVFDASQSPHPLEILREDALAAHEALQADWMRSAASSMSMPAHGGGCCATEEEDSLGHLASQSTMTGGGASRPTSATTSACGTVGGQASRPVSANPSSSPAVVSVQDDQGVQIIEDDGEGDDDIDEAIERMRGEAAFHGARAPMRQRVRPAAARQKKDEAIRPRPASARPRRPLSARARLGPEPVQASFSGHVRASSPPWSKARPASAQERGAVEEHARESIGHFGIAGRGLNPQPPRNAPQRPGRPFSARSASARPAVSSSPPERPLSRPPSAPPRQNATDVDIEQPQAASLAEPEPPPPQRPPQRAASANASLQRAMATHVAPSVQSTRPRSARRAASANSQPLQRPTSAGRGRGLARQPISKESSSSPATKKVVYSQQLISRHNLERDAKSRIISTLARQLERYRDMLPVWAEQHRVVRGVVSRSAHMKEIVEGEMGRLRAERECIEQDYERRAEALAQGLMKEQENARASAAAKHAELNKSVQEELNTSNVVIEEEQRNKALRCTLDQTMEQLNSLRTEVLQYQADADNVRRGRTAFESTEQAPELIKALRRMEAVSGEKQQVASEMQAARNELLRVQDELNHQRTYALRLEEFVRRISAGGGRYVLDPTRKREALSLIRASDKLRGKAIGALAAQEAVAAETQAAGPFHDNDSGGRKDIWSAKASVLASKIMQAADGIARNGHLSMVELEAFLGTGTDSGKDFGAFLDWLMSDRARRFKRWDGDHDGTISLPELQNAVGAFLSDLQPAPRTYLD